MAVTTQSRDTSNITNTDTPKVPSESYAAGESISLAPFDAQSFKPNDLQTDSSSLTGTTAEDTKNILQSIREKRNTVAIVRANIGLTSDLVKAATEYRKLEGLVIDWETEGINNQVKRVRQEVAQVRLDREGIKLEGERHLNEQERVKTTAIGEITPIIQEEWEARKELARAKVEALRDSVASMQTTYDDSRAALTAV